jgi:4-hydroxy-4-methyl-2-oxoglutarate aldolase
MEIGRDVELPDPSVTEAFRGAIAADAHEAMGKANAMAPEIGPVTESTALCGPARTVRIPPGDNLMVHVGSQLAEPGDVLVIAAETTRAVTWGELLTLNATERGIEGVVSAGNVRDIDTIAEMDFPVFAGYRSPLDIRGRAEVVDFGTPVTFRGLDIVPGQLVFADANGIVAVPPDAEEQVLERCEDRIAREQTTQEELEAGGDPAEVYERYGAF